MKLLIVDDEPLARQRLAQMVAELPGWEVIGEVADGQAALDAAEHHQPDVVLLDIHMPGMDGLQVARMLAEQPVPPAVVFTTAHDQHALSAHDTRPAGYLLKPVRRDRLATALMRARQPSRAQMHSGTMPAAGERRYVHGQERDGVARVPVDDIVCFIAEDKYVTVHHLHGQLLIEESLRSLEGTLGPGFIRVHRKALAARDHIQALRRGPEGPELLLRHLEIPVPVSRRRLGDVRQLLEQDQ
ncbi:LytTR family DNA-binding domain-containing protein [Spectribacter hydrogenoxidans]|uniref:LytTR family DNA-binding domain-containing protein n=1 Tax=Spectribacter hydrogenoxidans TaxID=3075608 RepID=A0ABU3BZA1_9GAMM|nr:LytTR family DNA-binding domain-containing protein [Salinisphaera sp. W335]MDT0634631.1 LytTR family DNA-binding domain-containing protein [Salinisphaera sp. W335]